MNAVLGRHYLWRGLCLLVGAILCFLVIAAPRVHQVSWLTFPRAYYLIHLAATPTTRTTDERNWTTAGVTFTGIVEMNETMTSHTTEPNNSRTSHPQKVLKVSSNNTTSFNSIQQPKVILLWTNYYGKPWGAGVRYPEHCSSNCIFTNNRNLSSTSDALMFHSFDVSWNDIPRERNTNQRYVFFSREPPTVTRVPGKFDSQTFANFFNWTVTYRRDSDVFFPYRRFLRRRKAAPAYSQRERDRNRASGGMNETVALAIVSNCHGRNRLRIIEEISKHLPVDKFGRCFKNEVCRGKGNGTAKCLSQLVRRYKLLLSFENSSCKDYITEKYWYNALDNGVIPIVMGASQRDYEDIVVPKSYIYVPANATSSEIHLLTNYLKQVTTNRTLFDEYQAWRQDYGIYSAWGTVYCDLCTKLHDDQNPKIYGNFSKWWDVC